MSVYTKALSDAIADLKSIPPSDWREVKKRAAAVGIEKPEEGKEWSEMAEAIAIAEFEKSGQPLYQDPAPPSEPDLVEPETIAQPAQPAEPTTVIEKLPPSVTDPMADARVAMFERFKVHYCKSCEMQLQSDASGRICSAGRDRADCPQLNSQLS